MNDNRVMTSPFNWRGTPSALTKDSHFNGKSANSARAAQIGIKTGRIQKSIAGLSDKSDARMAEQGYKTQDQDKA